MKKNILILCYVFFCTLSVWQLIYGSDVTNPLLRAGMKPGERQTITVNNVEFAFRWCPAGSFIMGSPESEKNRYEDEIQHEVVFTKGFWILETEVTQRMYQAIRKVNPSNFKGETLPVDTVTWQETMDFAQELSRLTNLSEKTGFTLPTEAQWEYACRAGSSGPYYGKLEEIAWSGEERESGTTHSVGIKKPNAWGIHDMHGNLWEWCLDAYREVTKNKEVDPFFSDVTKSGVRIDRGGCWDSTPDYCRSAHRGSYEPDRKSTFVGFRIVLVPILK